jgi:hypothetical protein
MILPVRGTICGVELHEVDMATITELKSRREALAASRSSGVARVSYDGKTVDYRSLAEIDRAIEVLDREIATAEGRKIIRQVRVITTKEL